MSSHYLFTTSFPIKKIHSTGDRHPTSVKRKINFTSIQNFRTEIRFCGGTMGLNPHLHLRKEKIKKLINSNEHYNFQRFGDEETMKKIK
ncbi:MAG: hypothetical protein ACE5GL_07520 [Calditrichia bacterium]